MTRVPLRKKNPKINQFQYLFENIWEKRGVRWISTKNSNFDDVNFSENSRILNFFNNQINFEEIKYEKIIQGMKISFLDQKFLVIIQ